MSGQTIIGRWSGLQSIADFAHHLQDAILTVAAAHLNTDDVLVHVAPAGRRRGNLVPAQQVNGFAIAQVDGEVALYLLTGANR